MSIDYANLTIEQLESMSDEDFAKLDPSQLGQATQPEPVEQPQVEVEVAQEPAQPVEQEQEQPVVEEEQPNPDEPASDEPANGAASEAEQHQAAGVVTQQGEEAQEVPKEETQKATDTVAPEKAFYDKVTAGFKANGKTYKIDDPDDLIALAQQGLNYNQKMAAIKPSLKIVRALQERGIESLEQLGELLDLHDKKPEAIAALVQKSGIDTYQLEEQAKNYVPSVPQVNDQLFEFEQTAKSLESNPHFGTVVNHLQTFDEQTRQEIFTKPHLLSVLTDHVANGYYDQIMSRLEIEQATGRTRGMTFLQAYDAIGNQLFGQPQQQPVNVPPANYQSNITAHGNPPVQQVAQTVPTQVVAKPVPVAQKQNTSNNAARQAAASTTGTATTVQKIVMTPEQLWALSDEEFAKINPKYL